MATIRDTYVLEVQTEEANRKLDSTSKSMGGLGKSAGILKGALGPIAAGLAAIGGISVVGAKIDEFDALAKSARAAGAAASNEAFQGFQILKQAMNEAGIDAGTFDRAMLQTSSRLQEGLEGGKAFSEIVGKLGDSIKDSEGNLVDGSTALQAMINALNEGKISTDEFAKVVGGRAGPLIQAQFASLNTTAEQLQATLDDVADNSDIVSLDAANNAEKFNDTVGRLQGQLGQLLTDAITPLLPVLVELAEGALAALPAVIDTVKEAFSAFSPIIEALSPLFSALMDLLGPLWELFKLGLSVIEPVVSILADGLVMAFKAVGEVITFIVESITSFIDGLVSIKDAVADLTGSIGDGFSGMKDSIGQSVGDAVEGTKNKFKDLWQYLWGGSVAKDIVNETKDGFAEMSSSMIDSVAEAAKGIKERFTEVYNSIKNGLGTALNGAVEGVKSIGSGVSGWFKDTFSGVEETAKGAADSLNSITAGDETLANTNIKDTQTNIQELQRIMEEANPTIVAHTESMKAFNETYNSDTVEQMIAVNEQLVAQAEAMESLNEWQTQYVDLFTKSVEQSTLFNEALTAQNELFTTTTELMTALIENVNAMTEAQSGQQEIITSLNELMTESVTIDQNKTKSVNDLLAVINTATQSFNTYVSGLQTIQSESQRTIEVTNNLSAAFGKMADAANKAKSASEAAAAAARNIPSTPSRTATATPRASNTNTGNMLSGLFDGFFANGGTIGNGKFGIVGERGPELVTGPATITPMDQLSGGVQNVTYNISAVDAVSFKNLIAKDPGFIHAVAQKGSLSAVRSR